jgi:lactoylglutathione lyase
VLRTWADVVPGALPGPRRRASPGRALGILGENPPTAKEEQRMYRRIDHTALHVSDLNRSIRFYEDHFGFTTYFRHTVRDGMGIAYLKLGDTVLELTHHSDGAMAGFHFCLETDDFDGSVHTLREGGVEVATPPHPTAAREARETGWRRVVFRGPDGELIELRG